MLYPQLPITILALIQVHYDESQYWVNASDTEIGPFPE